MRYRLLATAAIALAVGAPAVAQDENIAGRVTRIEKELKAVQRVVFPGGAGAQMIEPQITADPARPGVGANVGGSAVTDLIGRVDSLEAQVATLTGQVEQNSNRLRQIEVRLSQAEAAIRATPPATTSAVPSAATLAANPPVVSTRPVTTPAATAPKPAATLPKPAAPSAARTAAVAAIERPVTADKGDDAYSYGVRLWEAKFYPEAQVQLADMIKTYPKHPRVSRARNLLGRAWLDDGKPATSTKIFLENYQSDPRGDRAPDSLLYLGVALTQLKKTTEACQAFSELSEVYPDIAKGRLVSQLSTARVRAKCS